MSPTALRSTARRFEALAVGVIVAVVGAIATALDPWLGLEHGIGLQWLFSLRGPVLPPDDVVVVAMDEVSTAAFDADYPQMRDRRAAWPRSLHAEALRHLASSGARVVCLDLTFETPRDAIADQELAAAIRHMPGVVVAATIRRDAMPAGHVVESIGQPLEIFASAARAPFLLPKAPRVNTYWGFYEGAGGTVATLPVACFQQRQSDAFADLQAIVASSAGSPPPDASRINTGSVASDGDVTSLRRLLGDRSVYRRVAARLDEPNVPAPGEARARAVRMLARVYAADETTYLNFYGPPRTIRTISFREVIEQARSARPSSGFDFRGKSVFIGYSAATQPGQDQLRDNYQTVFSRVDGLDLSGVEIAATAFSNLEEDRVLHPLPMPWAVGLLLVWGLLLGMLACRLPPLLALPCVAGLGVLYAAVAYAIFARQSQWIPLAVPAVGQTSMALALAFWLRYHHTNRERLTIRRAFGQYLPPAIVDQLSRDQATVSQVDRVTYGVCLATDVEAYTGLAERMSPKRLGELMNSYYSELFKPVERHGGTVVDVVGDAMIAIWSAARSDRELRVNACLAALEALSTLNRHRDSASESPTLSTRFGLHAGDMLIGSIGAASHYEFRAVGDIVNTASRIQGLNKILGTQLLASAETTDALDMLACRPLGTFMLPGKANPVVVVELRGLRVDMSAEALAFLAEFATALEAYRVGLLEEARQRFAELVHTNPDDGPARFYLARCGARADVAAQAGWSAVVRIDTK